MLPGTIRTYGRRPSPDQILISHAMLVSQRSTCPRLRVGAVIARESRVIASGYNGTPPGMAHCQHPNDAPCEDAVHAEANAVAFAARYGVSTKDATIYVTTAPCLRCAQLIIAAGITSLKYGMAYRSPAGIQLLKDARVNVVRL